MMKLGLLMGVTLVGLFAVLQTYGGTDLRSDRRPAATQGQASAAQDAGAPVLTPPVPDLPAGVIPAATQTQTIVERFPGPALQPSPEFGGAPVADADDGPVLYVTASRLNMRSGAGSGNPVVGALDGGSAVRPIGPADGDWVQVRTASGQEGYVSGQFLSPEAP